MSSLPIALISKGQIKLINNKMINKREKIYYILFQLLETQKTTKESITCNKFYFVCFDFRFIYLLEELIFFFIV